MRKIINIYGESWNVLKFDSLNLNMLQSCTRRSNNSDPTTCSTSKPCAIGLTCSFNYIFMERCVIRLPARLQTLP